MCLRLRPVVEDNRPRVAERQSPDSSSLAQGYFIKKLRAQQQNGPPGTNVPPNPAAPGPG